MSKEKLCKIVDEKYKGKFKLVDIKDLKYYYVPKKIFNHAENHGGINYMDYAVMAAISIFNINLEESGFTTMPISVPMIQEVLGLEIDPRKRKEKQIKETLEKLCALDIISIKTINRKIKSNDSHLNTPKMKNKIMNGKFIVLQKPLKSSNVVNNAYLQLPHYAFEEIVYSENTDKTRMTLLAFYMCQAIRNYLPKKSSKDTGEKFYDNEESVINYQKIESIGKLYSAAKNTSYKHGKMLKDMNLIVFYKVKLKHVMHDFFLNFMTQRHLLPHMQSSIRYKIKNGIVIDVKDEKHEENVKKKKVIIKNRYKTMLLRK